MNYITFTNIWSNVTLRKYPSLVFKKPCLFWHHYYCIASFPLRMNPKTLFMHKRLHKWSNFLIYNGMFCSMLLLTIASLLVGINEFRLEEFHALWWNSKFSIHKHFESNCIYKYHIWMASFLHELRLNVTSNYLFGKM